MATISKKEFDKLVSHTIRIELIDGTVLHYTVTAESKTAFFRQLQEDAISEFEREFIWFYLPQDRIVLINTTALIRVTFCFDPPEQDMFQYHDNFNVIDKSELGEEAEGLDENEELYLPQLIIKHKRDLEDSELVEGVTMKTEGYFGNISAYYSLDTDVLEGFHFNYFEDEEEWVLLTFKYLAFIDDDGEENFMPLKNIYVIEVERRLIMSDEQRDLLLGNKSPKRQNKSKRK